MTEIKEKSRYLVVGGANGIGLESARILAGKGASLAIVDINKGALLNAQREMPAITYIGVADLSHSATTDRVISDAIAALGGTLDGLINCAGIDYEAPLESMTDDEWDRLFTVNLRAPMRVCRASFQALKAAGSSSVVNLSSGAGLMPLPNRTAYCSTKAGLIMMSKALALEWAPHGIRVNAICPGAVDTALFRTSYKNWPDPEARLQQIKDRYPLRRIAHPKELAEAVVFLASASASYITGTAMAVDGGRTFH